MNKIKNILMQNHMAFDETKNDQYITLDINSDIFLNDYTLTRIYVFLSDQDFVFQFDKLTLAYTNKFQLEDEAVVFLERIFRVNNEMKDIQNFANKANL